MIVDVGTWLLGHMWWMLAFTAVVGSIFKALLDGKARRDEASLHQIERAALGVTDRELELASKLLQTLHLSVAERRELPSGALRLSVLVTAARADLAKTAFLPRSLRPSEEFSGVLIELRGDTYWVHQQDEIGVGKYGPKVSLPCSDLKDAVIQYVDANGGEAIDGVPINRDR